jgi:hypothetical protein
MANDNPGIGPAALFMQSVASAPKVATEFVLRCLQNVLEVDGAKKGAFSGTMDVVATSYSGKLLNLKLRCNITFPALVTEMVAAGTHGLRVEPRCVVSNQLIQARLVAFIGQRVVAQLFSSRDGKTLKLEVEELPGARDLGNGVVAVERLNFSVHTPLGSVRKETMKD